MFEYFIVNIKRSAYFSQSPKTQCQLHNVLLNLVKAYRRTFTWETMNYMFKNNVFRVKVTEMTHKANVSIFLSLFQRNAVMKLMPLFGNLNFNKGNNSNMFCGFYFFLTVFALSYALWLIKSTIFGAELKPLGSETHLNAQNASSQWFYDRTFMRSSYDVQVIIWTFNEHLLQVRFR